MLFMRYALAATALSTPLVALAADTANTNKLEEILVTGDPMSRSSLDTVSSISTVALQTVGTYSKSSFIAAPNPPPLAPAP